jgi:hydrogenase expression/formation protein HypE
VTATKRIELAHGGGGRMSRELIDAEIVPRFGNGPLRGLPDAATVELGGREVVFSTDSFVVQPLEFPGGSIGDLAVHGTVNDLAAAGARARWLSLGLILEEGLPRDTLARVLDAVARAARACGVAIATGDTKVVGRGQCDGMYINTAGIGEPLPGLELGAHRIEVGDAVIASGTLGDHGMAVLAAREGIALHGDLRSDTGPVHRLVESLAELGGAVRFLRDPTRGGLAAVAHELIEHAGRGMLVREAALPLSPSARAAAEMLGIELVHVASEGRILAVVAPEAAPAVLDRWRGLPEGRGAQVIGRITDEVGRVVLETAIGGRRLVDVPHGELLPRIC